MKILDLTFSPAELESLLHATHGNPFAFLGPHQIAGEKWAIRVFAPHAREVAIIDARRAPRSQARVIEAPKVHP
ncbi:MAG: hypothetical protein JO117_05105, partial [Verrucomicrobia bacterium]|nr:hypothetical protein [Verrucomicrobiota bacterium]